MRHQLFFTLEEDSSNRQNLSSSKKLQQLFSHRYLKVMPSKYCVDKKGKVCLKK